MKPPSTKLWVAIRTRIEPQRDPELRVQTRVILGVHTETNFLEKKLKNDFSKKQLFRNQKPYKTGTFESLKILTRKATFQRSDLDICTWSIEALHELLESKPGTLHELLKFLFGGVETLVVRFALAELVLWVWHNSRGHERLEHVEANDTSHV